MLTLLTFGTNTTVETTQERTSYFLHDENWSTFTKTFWMLSSRYVCSEKKKRFQIYMCSAKGWDMGKRTCDLRKCRSSAEVASGKLKNAAPSLPGRISRPGRDLPRGRVAWWDRESCSLWCVDSTYFIFCSSSLPFPQALFVFTYFCNPYHIKRNLLFWSIK